MRSRNARFSGASWDCIGRCAVLVQYYREKIKAEAEGRTYVAPPPSKAAPSKPAGMTRNARSFGNSGWDDWGDEGSRPTKVSYFFSSQTRAFTLLTLTLSVS